MNRRQRGEKLEIKWNGGGQRDKGRKEERKEWK